MNIYLQLTREFNQGECRAIITSGQAVVLYRLAIMSKDGDWILREDEETMAHVIQVLENHGARYRFGAPLDIRWLRNGWSSHLEFQTGKLRVRTDFFTRPPRVSIESLAQLWRSQAGRDIPLIGIRELADMKKTNRERDYAVIGELARRMQDPGDQLVYSRSARDLLQLAREHPDLTSRLATERPVLAQIKHGREAIEVALDAERRQLMRANETRLAQYQQAAAAWGAQWQSVSRELAGMPLSQAHRKMVEAAIDILPFTVNADT